MTAFTASALEVELTAGTWTDITDRLKLPLTIKQGRATQFDEVGAAILTVALQNFDGELMPENSGSAFYPNFIEGIRIRWKVTKSSVTYTRFVGWIQAIVPDFPDSDIKHANVKITATDSLGVMAKKKLHSNFTEITLWRARHNGVACDVYEASGKTSGVVALMTNYSEDAAREHPAYVYDGTSPTLKFGSDDNAAIGGVVTSAANSSGLSCKTACLLQAIPLQISVHMKTPESALAAGTWICMSFLTYSGAAAKCHIAMAINGASNATFLMDAAGTTNLGLIDPLPFGQWVKITLRQNASNPAHMDVTQTAISGASYTITNNAIDIRDIREVHLPGALGTFPSATWGGVMGIGTRDTISTLDSWVGASTGTVEDQRTSLDDVMEALPISSTAVGSLATTVATGSWSDRSALDVAREIMRSEGGVIWARGRDSKVLWISRASTAPSSPVSTINVELDCDGPPSMVRSVDGRPTRIEVVTPVGSRVVIDAAAEAGAGSPQRSSSITTVNDDLGDAEDRATELLARPPTIQIRAIKVDLVTGATDHTAALFDESSSTGGLFPTQKIRISGLASSFFGVTTMDVLVQGWTEKYNPDQSVILEMDTSPA